MNPTHIVVHHSAITHDGKPQLDRINNSHKARGFNRSSLGYYVGYHTIIEQDGTKVRTRKYNEMGAHCQAQGRNYDSIGICLAGNFSEHLPTEAQRKALWECIDDVQSKYKIETIRPHGGWGKTECWGKLLSDDVLSEVIKDTPTQPSSWAMESIEKAKQFNISDFSNPQEPVNGNMIAWVFHKLGRSSLVWDGEQYVDINKKPDGYFTREQLMVVLDRAGFFNKE